MAKEKNNIPMVQFDLKVNIWMEKKIKGKFEIINKKY